MGLRQDVRSWMIYDDEVLGAVYRAMETASLSMVGQQLAHHPDIEMRGIGNCMMRIASVRIAESRDNEAQTEAMMAMGAVMNYAMGQIGKDNVAKAVDEIYASAFRMDQVMKVAGSKGPGIIRVGTRGD